MLNGADRNIGTRLTELPPVTCNNKRCSEACSLLAIQTVWPEILFIIPETNGDTTDAFLQREPSPTILPTEFTITSQSERQRMFVKEVAAASSDRKQAQTHAAKRPSGLDISLAGVTYRLVGRQLFHREDAHFTTQLLLDNRTFTYDDKTNSGVLINTGDSSEITAASELVTFVVYHRVTDAKVRELL